jgi:hypothetical protein
MNYKREYTLEFRKISNGSVFDITIMDYDIPTFPFRCFLEKQQENPFQILSHQAVHYLQSLPGDKDDFGFTYAKEAFGEMPSDEELPYWWYVAQFDKFEKLVAPSVYSTAYKELTPLQRIEELEDQLLKAQRKVKCGKTFFDFRHLKDIPQEAFDTYLNLNFLHLKRILPQIEEAFHKGTGVPQIAGDFGIPGFGVFHILGNNPNGDHVAAFSYTTTENSAPYLDEIPEVVKAFQAGKWIPEIARIFRVAESQVTRTLAKQLSNIGVNDVSKTSSPSNEDEAIMDD